MDNTLAVVISNLGGVALWSGFSHFRQILRTRKIESALSGYKQAEDKARDGSRVLRVRWTLFDKKVYSQASTLLFQKRSKQHRRRRRENIAPPIYRALPTSPKSNMT